MRTNLIRLALSTLVAIGLVVFDRTSAHAERPPYADHCLLGGDEIQLTAADGTIVCMHTEGDGYRILK